MSRLVLCVMIVFVGFFASASASGGTVLWLTADEGIAGQPAVSPTDSGDYSLTVSGIDGVAYSSDVAGIGAAASPGELAFGFDGLDDLIRISDAAALDLSGDYTIEFFAKFTGEYTADATWQLFERRDGSQEYALLADPIPYSDTLTNLDGSSGGAAFGGSDSLPGQGTWNHFALVYDSSNTACEGILYVNGVDKAGRNYVTGQGTNFSMTADLLLGASTVVGNGNLEGLLDEIRITDEALTPEEFLNVVPEPGTMLLLVVGAALATRRRRR